MPRDANHFYAEILRREPRRVTGYSEYGSRVMPVLELYAAIPTAEERLAFQQALESMLIDSEPKVRQFGVDICLGFFVFRDAIAPHQPAN